jgi:DNA polymerase (family 10)
MNKKQLVAGKLRELASKVELMETGSAVVYKKAAYFKAAKAVEDLDGTLKSASQLEGIRGIGEKTMLKIDEILKTGTLHQLENFNSDFSELLKIEQVGPKKARQLFNEYGAKTPVDVMKLIKAGKIDDDKLEVNVKRALTLKKERLPREEMLEIAEPIELHMRCKACRCIIQVAGSIRRCTETNKDIDILICGDPEHLEEARKAFLDYGWDLVTAEGKVRIDVVKDGVGVNGWFLPKGCYGSGLLHCTGSGKFNEALRSVAKQKGYKLSEYGLKDRETDEVVESWNEERIFELLGFDFIPPEERDGWDVLEKYRKS